MTPEQVQLVQQSYKHVSPIADTAADLFYNRLFETAPQVRSLFPDDLRDQKKKLMVMIGTVVTNLHTLDIVLPAASALAKRHIGYGTQPEHYQVVGAALLWTLEKGLGAAWTPDLAAAWTSAYTTLSDYMVSEAHGPGVKSS
jgi:hemoglobin-like flavoprotein